ncbi:MAG: DUF1573 domain-containing protein [Cryomorphaceae bacterium]|jgi:hypothetical protein|nr:DUF1573 domain-containing protein [Cryomorphaceae bacterium]
MKTTPTAFAAAILLLGSACSNPSDQIKPEEERMALEAVQSADLPELSFANETHDFGSINEGQVVETEFRFTNTGKAPLIISSAQGSCGCTVPEYPNAPVAPGEEGVIRVSFNSEGKPNQQSKTVTLTTNAVPSTKVLTITANVTPKSK